MVHRAVSVLGFFPTDFETKRGWFIVGLASCKVVPQTHKCLMRGKIQMALKTFESTLPTKELMGKVNRHLICFKPVIMLDATPPEMVKGFLCSLLPAEERSLINDDVLKLLHPVILEGLASKKMKIILKDSITVKPLRTTHTSIKSFGELVECLLHRNCFKGKRSEVCKQFSAMIHQTTGAHVHEKSSSSTSFSFKTWDKLIKMSSDFIKDPNVNQIEVVALGYVYRLIVHWKSKRASKRPIKQEEPDDHYAKLLKRENNKLLDNIEALMNRLDQNKEAVKRLKQENEQLKDAIATAVRCPILGVVAKIDAVVCPEGHTFDKSAIHQWFQHGHYSNPITRTTLGPDLLFPNRAISDLAKFYVDKFGPEI
jgi:uncharacterized protein YdcH (DUF465 family)